MSEFEARMPDISSKPGNWLPAIIRSGNLDLAVELMRDHPGLLHARFSGNATPLLLAAYNGHHELADRLLNMGAKMDFIVAIALGRTGIVQKMLGEDPRLIHKCSPDGWTPLHIAARYADSEMLSLLISTGADVNIAGKKSLTPLFFATRQPYMNAELLLANGADIDARGKHGFTVLHCAAAAGNADLVRFLIEHGADANLQTDGRQTAWAFAVRRGHPSVVSLLNSR